MSLDFAAILEWFKIIHEQSWNGLQLWIKIVRIENRNCKKSLPSFSSIALFHYYHFSRRNNLTTIPCRYVFSICKKLPATIILSRSNSAFCRIMWTKYRRGNQNLKSIDQSKELSTFVANYMPPSISSLSTLRTVHVSIRKEYCVDCFHLQFFVSISAPFHCYDNDKKQTANPIKE